MDIVLNQMLAPGLDAIVLSWPHRVLAMDFETDQLWWISLPRRRENGQVVPYMTGPRVVALSLVAESLKFGALKQAEFVAPGSWSMTDADYLAEAPTIKEAKQRARRLKERDNAWAIIEPLIGDTSTQSLARQISGLRPALVDQATKHDKDVATVYRLLHLYLAHGSIRNGLMPLTERCGAPGKHRAQRVHLGRKPNAFHRGDIASDGYVLSQLCKERLARGYALIRPTLPPRDAYFLTCGAFWATTEVTQDGRKTQTLHDPHLRPTFEQFDRWGAIGADVDRRAERLGFSKCEKTSTHSGGSSQSMVCAVGQIGMFDATSTDVYLTSMFSRQRKLPPMTRSLIKELRSGYYLGVYCGWENPSPSTALQTILCGAEDKVKLCAKYGITITADDWPGMLCRTNLVDNGEMRAKKVMDAEEQFGFGVEFVETYSGESKGDVESQHRTDHKKFDHRIVGSTLGRQRKRGEEHAADSALWNHYEYMRELLLYILDDIKSEAPELAPVEMIIAGVRPTHRNIFCWLRDHNQRADVPYDIDQMRAWMLPVWPAVIQYNGIVVKTADGTKTLPKVRFFCDELRDDHRFRRANASRTVIPVSVRFRPENLEEVWLPTSRGLLRVPNVSSEEKLRREATVMDLEDHMKIESIHRHNQKQTVDQAELDKVMRREAITDRATREATEEAKATGTKISKAKQRKNIRENKRVEQDALANGATECVAPDVSKPKPKPKPKPQASSPAGAPATDAANASMAAFLASLPGCE